MAAQIIDGKALANRYKETIRKRVQALRDQDRSVRLDAILVEGDERLFNQYGVILVNPALYPHVKAREGQAFIDWLTGPEGQRAIATYRIDGAQAFFPNARRDGE